jgi:hypothetical protein
MKDRSASDDIFGSGDETEYFGDNERNVGTTRGRASSDDPDDIYESTGANATDRQTETTPSGILVKKKEGFFEYLDTTPEIQLFSKFSILVGILGFGIGYFLADTGSERVGGAILVSSIMLFGFGLIGNGYYLFKYPRRNIGRTMDHRLLLKDRTIESESESVLYGILSMGTGFVFLVFAFQILSKL